MLPVKSEEDSSVHTEENASDPFNKIFVKVTPEKSLAMTQHNLIDAKEIKVETTPIIPVAITSMNKVHKESIVLPDAARSNGVPSGINSTSEESGTVVTEAGEIHGRENENPVDFKDDGSNFKNEEDEETKATTSPPKAPLHRLMMDYTERKEQYETEKRERAEASRKSGRPTKTPDKFVAGPASIFLNPNAFKNKDRKLRRKKELKRQRAMAKKQAAMELKQVRNQKPPAYTSYEMEVRKKYAPGTVVDVEGISNSGNRTAAVAPWSTAPPKRNVANRGNYKNRPFPEQLMLMLASRVAKSSLCWIPESNGKAFSMQYGWFSDAVMKEYFPCNPVGRIEQCLKIWAFRKTDSHKLPDGMVAYGHPLFQRTQPELVKQMKLVEGKRQKPRRRLAAHPVRLPPKTSQSQRAVGQAPTQSKTCPSTKPPSKLNESHMGVPGVIQRPVQRERQTGGASGASLPAIQSKYALSPLEKLALQRDLSKHAGNSTEDQRPIFSLTMPKQSPRAVAGRANTKRKADALRHGQTMSKRCRMVSTDAVIPAVPPRGSTKAHAHNSIHALAASVRSGDTTTIDTMHNGWEEHAEDTKATRDSSFYNSSSRESGEQQAGSAEFNRMVSPVSERSNNSMYGFDDGARKYPGNEAALMDAASRRQDHFELEEKQRRQKAAYFAAAAKQREAGRALKRQTMTLDEEIAKSAERLRSCEREQQRRAGREDELARARQHLRSRAGDQHRKMEMPPREDQEAARRRRLAEALYGSNTVAKRKEEQKAPRSAQDPRIRCLDAPQRDAPAQCQPSQERAIGRPKTTPLPFEVPQQYSNYLSHSGSAFQQPFQQQHDAASQQQYRATSHQNGAPFQQQYGAPFLMAASIDNSMTMFQQQPQQQYQTSGLPQQSGIPDAVSSMDFQQFLMMQQFQQ